MEYLTIKELILASEGQLVSKCSEETLVNDIVIDSRKASKENAFVAIVGENLDGHDFINLAINQGCKTIIKNKDNNVDIENKEINVIEVNNTEVAFGDIARLYKNKFEIPFIAVTGSVGKTTTRDMVYSTISAKYNSLKNVGNLNNQFGVPLTLFNLNKEHECAVIEMGMSGFNEIEYLVNIVNPQIGIISNIGYSHVEHLGSRDGIFKAKMEITTNFDENSLLIVNGDDDCLKTLKDKHLVYKLKTFGFEKDNDIYCESFEMDEDNINFIAVIDGKREEFFIPTVGKHNIYNAMAAILVGINLNMTLEEIKDGLKNFQCTKNRLDIIKSNNLTIIDSVYNASIDSMTAALNILGRYKSRRVAILGDMFEMGEFAEFGHRQVGKSALNNVDILISIGKDSEFIVKELKENNMNPDNLYHFETKEEAIEKLDDIIKENDTILVKASRGMHLEKVVEHLNK
ncbi:MAG: UDP-N-acetylmuramoyl-tripeptide--D-alanyl-D-alanine ligase [Terrisporobacter othiniensis]|uniref:UDP-N-acetylmuramoyl-tripeptide--D-alanyl-D-alanine ligase n=1 Tax=Terrisporobacter hibernicus TaxID=2813371 RepID=A0AAX2ZBK5_9FIRM|nr:MULTISPECIES: UDP-N-acetylmuramoyl-tripeptide--D-alanyl-D-alanine ligase [Terrisporobacter]MBN9646597.1 UDP-N-acetylmuramoyl-tripeptide--D-alanyl-D-alanine ligase [Terrisporobacter glycolicus]MDU4859466.1 UDP-N-acetylmuramoyl-tripeptide--D-alanyl-D-alanine ligase [Terrisporobacter othiniensis]MDU6993853.1 UDP-N-acetylmuramoyl-tripeptide--D-alanyl-D-alanine ligase [Terrisporobacter othiniensis]UEL46754.1 UDP-N-acetylmuramoyl-tripeptide--D-alanyl-D-alanine ligase [Terrisporobacter hibernicus]